MLVSNSEIKETELAYQEVASTTILNEKVELVNVQNEPIHDTVQLNAETDHQVDYQEKQENIEHVDSEEVLHQKREDFTENSMISNPPLAYKQEDFLEESNVLVDDVENRDSQFLVQQLANKEILFNDDIESNDVDLIEEEVF